MSTPPAKPPEILDKIVDLVLSYKPKRKPIGAKNKQKKSLSSSSRKAKDTKN